MVARQWQWMSFWLPLSMTDTLNQQNHATGGENGLHHGGDVCVLEFS